MPAGRCRRIGDGSRGEYGLLYAYSPSPDAAKLTDRLGHEWLTLKSGIKPNPSCWLNHAAIDAALKLRDKVPADKQVDAKLTVEINAAGMQLVGGDETFKKAPRSTFDAQFRVYFQTAAWLVGKVHWASYDKIHDSALLTVTKNMTVKKNKDLPDGGAIVTIEGLDGGSLRIDVASGDPANWVGDAALQAKFMD